MSDFLRSLLPPKQTSCCSGCGRLLTERRRRPCPSCGDTRRTIARTAHESLDAADRPY